MIEHGNALQCVLDALGKRGKNTDGTNWQCPAHDDARPSLSVNHQGDRVLMNCLAGCSIHDVLAALDLTMKDLYDEPIPPGQRAGGIAWTEYIYQDEGGNPLFKVLRSPEKNWLMKRYDAGTWTNGMTGQHRVPYRLPQLSRAVREGTPVYIVEGEKDVHTLERVGCVATTNPNGAGKWTDDYSEYLRGADVRVIGDNDAPGRAHVRKVLESLDSVAKSVTAFVSPFAHDISDHMALGKTLDDLVPFADESAPSNDVPDTVPEHWAEHLLSAPIERRYTVSLKDFLAQGDAEFDWLIEGLLERGDRLIVTGPEGGGKSTLMRQMAIQVASGLHPFTLEEIAPLRSLIVDLENPARLAKRKLREISGSSEQPASTDRVSLAMRPAGIDLLNDEDVDWLEAVIAESRADIVFVGPLYKMGSGDPKEEKTAKPIALALDAIRSRHNFALVLEAHTAKGQSGSDRSKEPFGAALWLRWPEFGFHLSMDGVITHWRGQRDERSWPSCLIRGDEWPWEIGGNISSFTFAKVLDIVREEKRSLSVRELASRLGVGKSTVQRAITNNKRQYDSVVEEVTQTAL